MSKIEKDIYQAFLSEIKEKIHKAQYEAMKQVNKTLLTLYWEIGKDIVEKQNEYAWGKSIVETLSKDLQKEFPGVQGFSSRNLWNMRLYYLSYMEDAKMQTLSAEISFSHNLLIIERCKDSLERKFYMGMSKRMGWSHSVLEHKIEGKAYEKFLLNQTNFDQAIPEKYKHQAKLAVKDEYNFDFLEIGDEYSERELESGLVKNIQKFLLELGGDFSFMGNQYRLELEGESYFVDILLYHRKLKSLIAIELKTVKFAPEHAGKMQFYLSLLDEQVKQADENPSIGIIVCKTKSRTMVEYTLKEVKHPIGVASYTVTETLPKEYKNLLPSPKEIEETLLRFIDDIQTEE